MCNRKNWIKLLFFFHVSALEDIFSSLSWKWVGLLWSNFFGLRIIGVIILSFIKTFFKVSEVDPARVAITLTNVTNCCQLKIAQSEWSQSGTNLSLSYISNTHFQLYSCEKKMLLWNQYYKSSSILRGSKIPWKFCHTLDQ